MDWVCDVIEFPTTIPFGLLAVLLFFDSIAYAQFRDWFFIVPASPPQISSVASRRKVRLKWPKELIVHGLQFMPAMIRERRGAAPTPRHLHSPANWRAFERLRARVELKFLGNDGFAVRGVLAVAYDRRYTEPELLRLQRDRDYWRDLYKCFWKPKLDGRL